MPSPITSHWRLILPRRVSILIDMADNKNTTFEHELRRLEKRVDALVRVCDQLQDENKSLKFSALRKICPPILN